jgi:hypothetical protein
MRKVVPVTGFLRLNLNFFRSPTRGSGGNGITTFFSEFLVESLPAGLPARKGSP